MSKSLGNIVKIRDLLDRGWPGEAIRHVMLSTHYRSPLNWTETALHQAERELDKWYAIIGQFKTNYPLSDSDPFYGRLLDDLNTPGAIARMREFYKAAIRGEPFAGQKLRAAGQFLGLFSFTLQDWLQLKKTRRVSDGGAIAGTAAMVVAGFATHSDKKGGSNEPLNSPESLPTEKIEKLVSLRNVARKEKNWDEADRIRAVLLKMRIELKDSKDPLTGDPTSTWEVAR